MLIWTAILWLACAAIFLEMVERAPALDSSLCEQRLACLSGLASAPGRQVTKRQTQTTCVETGPAGPTCKGPLRRTFRCREPGETVSDGLA